MDWKLILERDGPSAWRAAYRLLGNAADADDCLQEAVLNAVELSRREPVGNWRALLIRLASARAMDQLRRRYRSGIVNRLEGEVPSGGHDPSDTAHFEDLQSHLRIAIAHLSQEQAAAFSLCALEGWTYADAAEQLQMPVNTIGVLVHRAREQLRELLQHIVPSPTPARSHQ